MSEWQHIMKNLNNGTLDKVDIARLVKKEFQNPYKPQGYGRNSKKGSNNSDFESDYD